MLLPGKPWTPWSALALAVGCLLAPGSPTRAQAPGVPLPGTQPADGSGDPSYPPFRDGAAPGTLDPPSACAGCHAAYRQPGQAVHEPHDTWSASMMAQAGRDPLFWAVLDIANQNDEDGLGDVGLGDFCLRCHAPQAWLEGRARCATPWGEEFDGACLQGDPAELDNDHEGITCHYCHRQYDASDPPPGEFADPAAPHLFNAGTYLSSERATMRGPYADAQSIGSHEFALSEFHRTSEFCGQCHDVRNPVRNLRNQWGNDLGVLMPVDMSYSEWKQSAFGDPTSPSFTTCQQCHMAEADTDGDGAPDAAYACSIAPEPRGPGSALGGQVRTHFWPGGNTWLLGVLRDLYGDALGRRQQFDAAIAATRRMLARSITVDVWGPAEVEAGTVLNVTARVTNLTGHKFPTGYPEGRRAWVHVLAGPDADGDGTLDPSEATYESNVYHADTGVLDVLDPQPTGNVYVPKVYETKYGIWGYDELDLFDECDIEDGFDGQKIFHAALNDCIVQDNRIPPLGFRPEIDTRPVGYVYPENPDMPGTLANWDDTPYRIRVPVEAVEPMIVEVEVHYQTASAELIEFLAEENRSTCDPTDPGCDPTQPDARPNRGEKLLQLWEESGRSPPEVVGTARLVVPVVPRGGCCIGASCLDVTQAECDGWLGTYQGDGVACPPECVQPPEPPPGEPSDVLAGAAPLRVTAFDPPTGVLSVAYEPACDAPDHAIAWGPLALVGAHLTTGMECARGASGEAEFQPGPGSLFFLVVGRNRSVEGSLGRTSLGDERTENATGVLCDFPQDLTADCR